MGIGDGTRLVTAVGRDGRGAGVTVGLSPVGRGIGGREGWGIGLFVGQPSWQGSSAVGSGAGSRVGAGTGSGVCGVAVGATNGAGLGAGQVDS